MLGILNLQASYALTGSKIFDFHLQIGSNLGILDIQVSHALTSTIVFDFPLLAPLTVRPPHSQRPVLMGHHILEASAARHWYQSQVSHGVPTAITPAFL